MASNPLWYDATVEAAVNAVTALLNGGSLVIYEGTQPAVDGALGGTILATMSFAGTAFGNATAAAGTVTATAGTITSGTASATGTAQYFALMTSAGGTVGTGECGTSGSDLNLNSTAISSGATVTISSFTITESQTG